MTEIGTLLTVIVSVLAPFVLIIAAPLGIIWAVKKMCECVRPGRTKDA